MKRWVVLMVTFLLLLALSSPAFGLGASSGESASCPDEMLGDGTPENPYQICKPSHFLRLNDYPAAHFVVVNDIDFSGFQYTPARAFSGTIDGRNHTISNFTTGLLVDWLQEGGVIKRLRFTAAEIDCISWDGVVAGISYGTVDQVVATGITFRGDGTYAHSCGLVGYNNSTGVIKNSFFSGKITGGVNDMGGITGINAGVIQNSVAIVEADGQFEVGGISGDNYGLIENSIAIGKVAGSLYDVGGITGRNTGTIKNSLAFVDVYYNPAYANRAGKVYGSDYGGLGTVINSYGFGRLFELTP